jgi:RNA polymerase sigma factor (sigma-70 family)
VLPGSDDASLGDMVRAALAGDEAAMQQLFQRCLPQIQQCVDRETGLQLRQQESRSDLVQSVCREMLEDFRRQLFEFRSDAEFRQWLQQATVHKVQQRARWFGAQKRNAARAEPLDGAVADGLADSGTPSRAAADREDVARFRAALARLDATAQQVVELAWFQQLAHREVAARLGITEAHSRVVLSRALARIAKLAAPQ